MSELLAYARTRVAVGPGVCPEVEIDRSAAEGFAGWMNSFETTEAGDAFIEAIGIDLATAEYGGATGPEFQWSNGDCQADLAVIRDASTGLVVAYHSVSCHG